MLSTELLEDVNQLVAALETPFQRALQLLSKAYQDLFPLIAGTAEGGAKINEFASKLHNAVVEARKVLDDMPVHEFFRSVDVATIAFESFVQKDPESRAAAHSLGSRIRAFSGLFDRYVRQQIPTNAMPVLREAHGLQLELDAFFQGLQTVGSELALPLPRQDEDTLTLTLHGEYSLAETTVRLSAFNSICSNIDQALEGYKQAPFRLLKLETGSVSLTVAAGALAIAMLRRFLVAAVQFAYRNYTREGKLRYGVHDQVQALEELIKLRIKLDKAGIDTEQLNRRLEAAGRGIAENLATLVAKENRVRIDREEFVNADDDDVKRLDFDEVLRLGNAQKSDQGKE